MRGSAAVLIAFIAAPLVAQTVPVGKTMLGTVQQRVAPFRILSPDVREQAIAVAPHGDGFLAITGRPSLKGDNVPEEIRLTPIDADGVVHGETAARFGPEQIGFVLAVGPFRDGAMAIVRSGDFAAPILLHPDGTTSSLGPLFGADGFGPTTFSCNETACLYTWLEHIAPSGLYRRGIVIDGFLRIIGNNFAFPSAFDRWATAAADRDGFLVVANDAHAGTHALRIDSSFGGMAFDQSLPISATEATLAFGDGSYALFWRDITKPSSNILATKMAVDGTIGAPIDLGVSGRFVTAGFGSDEFLVAFSAGDVSSTNTYAFRVSSELHLLDPTPLPVTQGVGRGRTPRAIASSGGMFALLWTDFAGSAFGESGLVRATTIVPWLQARATSTVSIGPASQMKPAVAASDTSQLIAWMEYGQQTPALRIGRGDGLATTLARGASIDIGAYAVAAVRDDFLVAWKDDLYLRAAIVRPNGSIVPLDLGTTMTKVTPSAVSNGKTWLIAAADDAATYVVPVSASGVIAARVNVGDPGPPQAASDGSEFAIASGELNDKLVIVNADGSVAVPQKSIARYRTRIVGDRNGYASIDFDSIERIDHRGNAVASPLYVFTPNLDMLADGASFEGGFLFVWNETDHSLLARVDGTAKVILEKPFAVSDAPPIVALATRPNGTVLAVLSQVVIDGAYGEAFALFTRELSVPRRHAAPR